MNSKFTLLGVLNYAEGVRQASEEGENVSEQAADPPGTVLNLRALCGESARVRSGSDLEWPGYNDLNMFRHRAMA